MRSIRILGIFLFLAGLVVPAAPARADQSVQAKAAPAGFLNADGTLRLDGQHNGTLDISGYNVQLDPQRGPVFSAPDTVGSAQPSLASLALFGKWAAVGQGGGVVNDYVKGMAVHNNNVYVVGYFTNLNNDPTIDYVAKWNGTSWSGLGSNGSGNGSIDFGLYSVAVDPANGNVYVGGYFTSVNDNGTNLPAAAKVAMWDGTHWHALGSDGSGGASISSPSNADVYAIAISGSKVYVGGYFQDLNDSGTTLTAADYIAVWDTSTQHWSALGSDGAGGGSLNNGVNAIAVDGSDVYVGGYFTNVNDSGTVEPAADYVAMWDGVNWNALGSNGSGNGAILGYAVVNALAVDGNGNVYVGGQFGTVYDTSGTPIPGAVYIAKWAGGAWSALSTDGAGHGSLNGNVYSILVSGTDLYVGGSFTNVNDNGSSLPTADYVARWNGTHWLALGSNGAGDGAIPNKSGPTVMALAKLGTKVIVGGAFYDVNNGAAVQPQADFIAQWDGTNWAALGTAVNGALANGYTGSEVSAIAVFGSTVYVGGQFINASDSGLNLPAADYVAKWDGTHWSALGSNGSGDGALNGSVYALAVDSLGNLYVGGGFTHVNNNGTDIPEAQYIAEWNGTNWSALGNAGQGHGSLNASVSTIAVSGGNVYVGGSFSYVENAGVADATIDYIAQWDGTNWSSLGNNGAGGGSLSAYVDAIAVSGSNVYVGGGFTAVYDGTTTPVSGGQYIAMWNGSHWSALGGDGAGSGPFDNAVRAMAISGSNLYAGGDFQHVYDGTTAPVTGAQHIARWDGSHWNALGNNALNSSVLCIAVDVSGVYAGGFFYDAGGVATADRIARWNGSAWSALSNNGSGDGVMPVATWDETVNALAVSGTNLLVGGHFSDIVASGTRLGAADYLAAYGMQGTATFVSTAANDGWVMESGYNTKKGGSYNATNTTLLLGDMASRSQYRSVLSFSTGPVLPDGALISAVTLKVRKQGILGGGNPVTMFQGFMVDVKKGYFGPYATLESADFQALASKTIGPFTPVPSNGWYTLDLTPALASINKASTSSGLTQIRLRFKLATNGNAVANDLSLFSGNAIAASRPQLIVRYYMP